MRAYSCLQGDFGPPKMACFHKGQVVTPGLKRALYFWSSYYGVVVVLTMLTCHRPDWAIVYFFEKEGNLY